ncbi:MAG: ankyrin repeat domain-containing protein [Candidatus Dependentiae bacterium]|nr:ankyrin repeat domain-containing protein [Candidatus Dependentiae bacterium]
MKTIKILIIATALAATLGPVSVYAMDQEQKPEEAATAAQVFTPQQIEQANVALFEAIYDHYIEGVNKALRSGADVNHGNARGNTPLWSAISRGNAEIVRILIEARADVNLADQYRWTPLRWAIDRDNAEIVRILIKARADVNHGNARGNTPLWQAINKGNAEIVRILIESCADVNHGNARGNTPLWQAIRRGNAEIVRILEEIRQLQLTAQRTPHIAPFLPVAGVANITSEYAAFTHDEVRQANESLQTAINTENVDGVTQALMSGADVNHDYNRDEGFTPLIEACYKGHARIVELLLKHGAQINQGNHPYGCTALLAASIADRAEIVELLLKYDAQINQPNQHGIAPLLAACEGGHTRIVALLLKHNAHINQPARFGRTPLSAACYRGDTATVKMLVFHGATPSGQESEDMKKVIRQAQEARRQLGDQDWLPQELVATEVLATHLQVKSIEELMSKLADPRVGIEDVEIQKLIEEQILKNKKQNAEKRSPEQESTNLPHRRMSVEQVAAQGKEDARAHDVRAPLPQSQPEQLLPSHDGDNLYRPLEFYIDQLSRDERLAQNIKDSIIARLFQAAGDSGQLDVPTAEAITISALEADGIRLHTMNMPVDSLPEERKDAETEEKNNAPEKSQQEQMREARLKRFDTKK